MDDRTYELPCEQGFVIRISLPIRGHQAAFTRANWLGGAGERRTISDLRRGHQCFASFKPPLASADFTGIRSGPQRFSSRLLNREVVMTNEISSLVEPAARLESVGAAARATGDETAAETCFRDALGLAVS